MTSAHAKIGVAVAFLALLFLAVPLAADQAEQSVADSIKEQTLRKEFVIVVVASGPKGSAITSRAERSAKAVFPDAYARIAMVFMGCIH